jgi:hypothetical protein
MPVVRTVTGVPAEVRHVQDLLQKQGAPGRDPGRD